MYTRDSGSGHKRKRDGEKSDYGKWLEKVRNEMVIMRDNPHVSVCRGRFVAD